MKLLMITGLGSAKDLAYGRKGAFYNTLEEFSKYWDRIDIISPKITNYELRITNLFNNVFIHVSPWPLIFHPIFFIKKVMEIHRKQKFDVMTVHEFPPFYNGIAARLLWQRIKVPYVLEIHHVPGYPRAADKKEEIYRSLIKMFIEFDSRKSKAVRVVNQKQTPEFLIEAGVLKEKIIYIPSAYIDLDIFSPTAQQQPNSPTVKDYDLIFVGRLEKNKGVDLLLEALDILSKTYNLTPKTLIVGTGSLLDEIKYKIQNTKYKVQLHGWAKDAREIAKLLNKSKILIMSSYNEGGPRIVLEAMACGVPVLATNVGLMPDFANKNAVKIVDWDAEDIAKKAKELLENDSERERLGKIGLAVAQQFEKKEMIRNYADKLKSLSSS